MKITMGEYTRLIGRAFDIHADGGEPGVIVKDTITQLGVLVDDEPLHSLGFTFLNEVDMKRETV